MSENLINQSSGSKYKDIYTDYWLSLNEHYDYEERVRAYFIDASLKQYKKTNPNKINILDLGCGRGWLAPIISEFGS
jgi:2-polyprenyl-3-methyl-5-hydroxy-6-metoxy-1,4-benzoquinol methylase